MRNSTFITIPLRKHIHDFIMHEFGRPGEDFIRVHQNSFLGKTIVMAIEKLPYRQLKEKEVLIKPTKAGVLKIAELKILLPKDYKYYAILPEKKRFLADFLEKDFQQKFIFFIKGQVAVTGNELASIKMFMNLYQVDSESYDIDVARKCWRDYKDRVYKVNQLTIRQESVLA